MSYATASAAYRNVEILSASPGQLVVIVYDYLLVQLTRIDYALETKDVELRSEACGRANAAILELVGALDLERGGAVGQQLGSLYTFFMSELIDVSRHSDRKTLARITAQVRELRDAFSSISSRQTASAA